MSRDVGNIEHDLVLRDWLVVDRVAAQIKRGNDAVLEPVVTDYQRGLGQNAHLHVAPRLLIMTEDLHALFQLAVDQLELASVAVVLSDQACTSQIVRDRQFQHFEVGDRLDYVVTHAQAHGLDEKGIAALRCKQDHRLLGRMLEDVLQRLDTVHARHVDVTEDDVRTGGMEAVDPLLSTAGDDDTVTVPVEIGSDGLPDIGVVVDDQYCYSFLGSHHSASVFKPLLGDLIQSEQSERHHTPFRQ